MTKQIRIKPCPFCEGPPVVTAGDDPDMHEGSTAQVWCHECGAGGPEISSWDLAMFEGRYDLPEEDEVARTAVERWNTRTNHHRSLYDGGDEEGLNMFPRPPIESKE